MAVADVEEGWHAEQIPDRDRLFMRVHKINVDDKGRLTSGAISKRKGEKGMSTDWEKYRTAEDTRNAARKPLANGVIEMNVGAVRALDCPPQQVIHTPDRESDNHNRAHTDVRGEKTTEVRVMLRRLAKWVIPPPAADEN